MAKYQQFLSRIGSNRDRAALRGIFSQFLTDDDPPALKDLVLASITLSGTETTQITISGANTTGILLSGTSSADGISITGVCADGIHISGAMTAAGLHISGDQVIGILYDVTAAATDGLKVAVPTLITLTSGITLNGAGTFTTGITLSATAITTGITISAGSMTDAIKISGATPVDGVEVSSVCSAAAFHVSGTSATGLLIAGACSVTGINISGNCVTGISIGTQTTAGINIEGTQTLALGIGTTAALTTATTAVNAVKVQSNFTGADSAYHIANFFTSSYTGTGTGSLRTVVGQVTYSGDQATVTTPAQYLVGIHGRAQVSGDVDNTVLCLTGVHAQILNGAGTFTHANQVAALWVDWQEDASMAAVTTSALAILSNNSNSGVAANNPENVFYVYAPNVDNFFKLVGATNGGMVAANAGTAAAADGVIIKVVIDNATLYLRAASAWA